MVELDNRPELPEIFPETDVTVEGEQHTFKVSKLDNSTESELEYTLDKAPVGAIQSIQGVDQDGDSRTFSNGVDYELTSRTDTIQDQFEFQRDKDVYLLRYQIDSNTDIVTDDIDVEYTNGEDYRIIDCDRHYGDRLEWIDDGDAPENNQPFTVVYDVTFPTSVIQWQQDGENLPQANSSFYVTYRADSIISRYLDTHENELDRVEEALQEVINNKFVDRASGEALDELGKLFGPTIGKRRGRSDVQYRIYLKSVVQSFISRGTVNGIKLAISAATDVPIEDIEVNEDFENVEYEVSVIPNNPVTIDLLEEVAEIADPSGVNQVRTRFVPEPDITGIDDSTSFTEGQQILEDVSIVDTVAVPRVDNFEDAVVSDSTTINPNKFDVGIDKLYSDDDIVINQNKYQNSDDLFVSDDAAYDRSEAIDDLLIDDSPFVDQNKTAIDDNTSIDDQVKNIEDVEKNSHRWEETDDSSITTRWSFFEWTEELYNKEWNSADWEELIWA